MFTHPSDDDDLFSMSYENDDGDDDDGVYGGGGGDFFSYANDYDKYVRIKVEPRLVLISEHEALKRPL